MHPALCRGPELPDAREASGRGSHRPTAPIYNHYVLRWGQNDNEYTEHTENHLRGVQVGSNYGFRLGAFTGGRRAPQVRHFRVCRLSAPLMPPSGHLTVCYLPACTLWDL